jgi:hypothetical protein
MKCSIGFESLQTNLRKDARAPRRKKAYMRYGSNKASAPGWSWNVQKHKLWSRSRFFPTRVFTPGLQAKQTLGSSVYMGDASCRTREGNWGLDSSGSSGRRVLANMVTDTPVNVNDRELLAGQLSASQGHSSMKMTTFPYSLQTNTSQSM